MKMSELFTAENLLVVQAISCLAISQIQVFK